MTAAVRPLIRLRLGAIAAAGLLVGLMALAENRIGLLADPIASDWTLDRMTLQVILTALIHGGIFTLGAALARLAGRRHAALYVGLGAVATTAAFLLSINPEAIALARAKGVLAPAVGVPLLVGALIGLGYRRHAGFDADGDDPAAMAAAAADEDGLIRAGGATYYAGPLDVRTALLPLVAATLAGAGLHAALLVAMVDMLSWSGDHFLHGVRFAPADGMLAGTLLLLLPYVLFVRGAHAVLRASGRTGTLAYALAGLFAPLAIGMLLSLAGLGVVGPMLGFQFVLPSALAMIVYRSLAGLEPRALPADVEVADPRALVGADHPRRRAARVILPD